MADKVQAKPDASSTSIFHHGHIKLLVVEELDRLDKNCLTFLFLSAYEITDATPSRRTPKLKSTTPRAEQQPRVGKHPRAEQKSMIEKNIIEASTSTKRRMTRRQKREQSTKNGKIIDILEAIDIEEKP